MANAEHLKALLKAYGAGNQEHFLSVAEQVAAQEAKLGHNKLSQELQELIAQVKLRAQSFGERRPIPIAQPKGELASLLSITYPKQRLSDMVLPPDIHDRLARVVKEQRYASRIRSHGLHPRRKLLFVGQPGTGKTLSAAVLAGELNLPLFVVRLERLITKFMGETAAKLRLIFDNITQIRGVYLFDEFDTIGSQRGIRNDVGEIRRVLNSFLQFIESDESHSLILAATNHPEILDHALFRRFDDVIEYGLPSKELGIQLLKGKLASVKKSWTNWTRFSTQLQGMSYADISKATEDAIKHSVINEQEILQERVLLASLKERREIQNK
ncbi:MAG TPA: ATP-binding protein [Burkholderiales bacterium]|nr:ATP-binding protein [Burkholderiales bacterium]